MPREILLDIHRWWETEGAARTLAYEGRTYPGGSPPPLLASWDPADERQRRDWLLFLILGATHTMGRAQPGQHRAFLGRCLEEGWLDIFAAPHIDPIRWLGMLEDFLADTADHIEFFEWARQFVSIYQLARWLPEYVDAFLSIDSRTQPFLLSQVTAPRTDPVFQGGGPDAPPISQALGLGACFVVRELVRRGVLRRPLARPHCYTPTARVRAIFQYGLGLTTQPGPDGSRDIHGFLCEALGEQPASFGQCFDLPFIEIARDADLWQRFFGRPVPEEMIAFEEGEF